MMKSLDKMLLIMFMFYAIPRIAYGDDAEIKELRNRIEYLEKKVETMNQTLINMNQTLIKMMEILMVRLLHQEAVCLLDQEEVRLLYQEANYLSLPVS